MAETDTTGGTQQPATQGSSAQGGGGGGPPGVDWQDVWQRAQNALQRGDIAMALGVVALIVVLILPIPPWTLDVLLAVSITFSVMILMTAIFLEEPLEFNAFPTILLIATLLRLALNLASTRLILSHGHEGTDAAGQVIEAFGGFIMQGNFVIGVIVFAILVIVNFMVITKGSGRIGEVAARFSLDAMPGKQMAIDADLSSGLIDEQEAKRRREQLQEESTFFGAMDGAGKFVRGDAIAGILIVFINVVGGIIIGMVQQGMSFAEAANTFTRLTVGDGLVSQIPALTVSTAAGMVVTKAGIGGQATEKAVFGQVAKPKGLAMTSALLVALALVPGIPPIPFLLIAAILGTTAWYMYRFARAAAEQAAEAEAEKAAEEGAEAPPEEEPISTALKVDMLRLEMGYGLLQLINSERGARLTEQIKSLRRSIASEMGFIVPPVRIQDNMQIAANTYIIYIKEVEAGRGDLRPNQLLVMDPRGEEITLPGEQTTEPTFGLPAMWVESAQREEALFRGYTVVDPPTVITTHLTEVIKDNMSELLSYAETQKLLDELDKDQQKLVSELIPGQISVAGVQRVLQSLLQERVSIRDLPTVLEGIYEATGYTRNVGTITEHVRARLARQISDANADENGTVPIVTLSPEWEKAFNDSLVGKGEDQTLALAPSSLQDFINKMRSTFERFAMQGEAPVLLTSPQIRPHVRSVVERFRPATVVLSQNEIHPRAKIRTLGQV